MPRKTVYSTFQSARDLISKAIQDMKAGKITSREAETIIKGANAIIYSLKEEAGAEAIRTKEREVEALERLLTEYRELKGGI